MKSKINKKIQIITSFWIINSILLKNYFIYKIKLIVLDIIDKGKVDISFEIIIQVDYLLHFSWITLLK